MSDTDEFHRLQRLMTSDLLELRETQLELERHHRDFARISAVLDDWTDGSASADETLRRIRGIVG